MWWEEKLEIRKENNEIKNNIITSKGVGNEILARRALFRKEENPGSCIPTNVSQVFLQKNKTVILKF